ncbi:hypothetical protein [Nocardioides sp. GY 10127]|uniref:hypothetical protein n=1 Tax=Nocardioides sp. GY 10127 TaxID=2569762 RepID=UPI0010A8BCCD|nr:hypothetical protein [Nocardioides sp. GY 10127]TIC82537.1 hypothetical protein E8D37_07380 [Nocardioides sp. GY 10127]
MPTSSPSTSLPAALRPAVARALVGGVVSGGLTGYLVVHSAGRLRAVALAGLLWAARVGAPRG